MNNPDAVDGLLKDLNEILTADEIAQLLRVTPTTVTKWAREGHLHHLKIGRRMFRVRKEDLRDFLLYADESPEAVDD